MSTVTSCYDLDALPSKNGKRTGDNFAIGSTVTFSCDEGYELDGESKLTCRSDGHWSELVPLCKGIIKKKINKYKICIKNNNNKWKGFGVFYGNLFPILYSQPRFSDMYPALNKHFVCLDNWPYMLTMPVFASFAFQRLDYKCKLKGVSRKFNRSLRGCVV